MCYTGLTSRSTGSLFKQALQDGILRIWGGGVIRPGAPQDKAILAFRVLDHDADIRIEAFGASQRELFQNAAMGLFSLLTDPAEVHPVLEKNITVRGNGELLVNFLNELLFIWDTERLLPSEITVDLGQESVNALIKGEIFDENRHLIQLEMKAVTYHNFSISEENGIFRATFVVDV